MQLLELLTNFPNRTVVKTARNTFSRHLWYFSEMLVGLSFFDDRIGRCNNADGGKPPDCGIWRVCKTSWQSTRAIVCLWSSKLCYRNKCYNLWHPFIKWEDWAQNFLAKDPTEWNDDPSYGELKTAVSKTKVMNDSAERAILHWWRGTTYLWLRMRSRCSSSYVWSKDTKSNIQYPTRAKTTLLNLLGSFTRFPVCNLQIAVFTEKSYCCSVTIQCRTAVQKSVWHMAMCGLCWANVQPTSCPMSATSTAITLTCIN